MPPSSSERRNFVIDTSVLAYHGESVHSFAGHNLFVPIEVLEELDNLKTRSDSIGASSRYVNRYLDGLRSIGDLKKGVKMDNGQVLYVISSSDMSLLPNGMPDCVDNRIISVALQLDKSGEPATVLSRDISLRIRCDALGVSAESYYKDVTREEDCIHDGMLTLHTTKDVIDSFYQDGFVRLEDECFDPNQGVVLKCGQASALAIASDDVTLSHLRFAGGKNFCVEGISPRSKEQIMALELLMDPDIHMVSMTGISGCGKTMLAIASAMAHIQKGTYKKLILSRPVQSTSKDIGFLPGSKDEKLAPWLQPIFDNLKVIYPDNDIYIKMMMDNKTIELEALTYIRGRTLPDTIFIIDEAQNITHHEAKALLTRMGENSKIILIGDLEQIDSPTLDQSTSGLSSVVELFRSFEHSGHIRLVKGERSALAAFAAKVM